MTQKPINICVFAGSASGRVAGYREVSWALGEYLADQGIGVVYGGAEVGLMGAVADGALSRGGRVIGVLPEWLVDWEVAHAGLTELRVVGTMHERKAQMAELAQAFVVLPGGIGSLEECFEVWTWSQLGIHRKALGLLNVDGYYDRLLAFLDHVVEEQFLRPEHRADLKVECTPAALISALLAHEPQPVTKWVDRS